MGDVPSQGELPSSIAPPQGLTLVLSECAISPVHLKPRPRPLELCVIELSCAVGNARRRAAQCGNASALTTVTRPRGCSGGIWSTCRWIVHLAAYDTPYARTHQRKSQMIVSHWVRVSAQREGTCSWRTKSPQPQMRRLRHHCPGFYAPAIPRTPPILLGNRALGGSPSYVFHQWFSTLNLGRCPGQNPRTMCLKAVPIMDTAMQAF